MRLDKNQHLNNWSTRIRDYYRIFRHSHHPGYTDLFLQKGRRLPFKHHPAIINHMIDLRMWTITYAPNYANPLKRMQEIHKLTQEMQYVIYRNSWRRAFVIMLGMCFLSRAVFKKQLMNKGEEDSFEMSWRDVHIINV